MIGVILAKKVVRSAFQALSEHFLEGFMVYWAEDAKMIYPGPGGQTINGLNYEIEGREAISGWWEKFINGWQVTSFSINNISVVKHCLFTFGTNVVLMEYDLKLITSGEAKESDTSGVAVIKLKGGKFTEVRMYECLQDPIWRVISPRVEVKSKPEEDLD